MLRLPIDAAFFALQSLSVCAARSMCEYARSSVGMHIERANTNTTWWPREHLRHSGRGHARVSHASAARRPQMQLALSSQNNGLAAQAEDMPEELQEAKITWPEFQALQLVVAKYHRIGFPLRFWQNTKHSVDGTAARRLLEGVCRAPLPDVRPAVLQCYLQMLVVGL